MDWVAVIAVISTVSSIILAWTTFARNAKHDISASTESDVVQRVDVEYIKRGIDDIRADVRAQGQRVDGLSERVTRLEERQNSRERLDKFA
ncbi:hypothetical protein [Paenibacillus vini]|uniref:Uncharacterized protein n=1 Tax=Paenibacillus vini TaxID=1476024 RepID=A0ABQ4MAS8_9BACL|nr:hypothetical protein [Paenibacillus vini]GIP53098.1 hypothetical protein J42TS3_21330 [Paenibacillus vini]GIP56171.1 hypothetical protein J42TS3_52060 [Paenibacillus vini]